MSEHQQSRYNWLTERPYTANYYRLLEDRNKLPVTAHKERFLQMLNDNKVLLVEAETGSGKTTQIPQWCLDFKVLCTQPRRIAAISMAKRVAEEMDVKFGDEVGYHVRLESYSNEKTLLLYATDGICRKKAISDPLLSEFGVVILDEVHERNLETDVLIGFIQKILENRNNLRVVVMSASLTDAGDFKQYFNIINDSAIFKIRNRLHEYEAEMPKDYCKVAIEKILHIHRNESPGDILLFLTGQDEIEATCDALKVRIDTEKREHSGITISDLTIDGIVYVVDCGKAKQKFFGYGRYSTSIRAITKASAKQRAGRAGRTQPGKCYRLYTNEFFNNKMEQVDPEIKHSNLCSIALSLICFGVKDLFNFNFMDKPPEELLRKALLTLQNLDAIYAIENLYEVTELGETIEKFPVEPQVAIMLRESALLGCAEDAIIIASMLSVPHCFYPEKKNRKYGETTESVRAAKLEFEDKEGDHFTLLNVYRKFAQNGYDREWCHSHKLHYSSLDYARIIQRQITRQMRDLHYEIKTIENRTELYMHLRRALLSGFFLQVACFKITNYGQNGNLRMGYYVTADSKLISHRNINMRTGGFINAPSYAQFHIHKASVLSDKSIGYNNQPEFILFDHSDGLNLINVTKLKNPAMLLQDAKIYNTLSIVANQEFCDRLRNLEREEQQPRQNPHHQTNSQSHSQHQSQWNRAYPLSRTQAYNLFTTFLNQQPR